MFQLDNSSMSKGLLNENETNKYSQKNIELRDLT